MPTRTTSSTGIDNPVVERLYRRIWPILVSTVFVGLGSAFFFRWGSLVRHTPSLWISPADLTDTYRASVALAHGHLSAIYQRDTAFITFPGILIALIPFGALSNVFHTTFVEIMKNHHLVTQTHYLVAHTTRIWPAGTVTPTTNHTDIYAIQPQWFVFLGPYSLILSCVALFAFDALAERLQVTRRRRVVLTLAEVVVLWPVVVSFGHPEDAVSVALAVYALIFALDGRFTGAGWLFGARGRGAAARRGDVPDPPRRRRPGTGPRTHRAGDCPCGRGHRRADRDGVPHHVPRPRGATDVPVRDQQSPDSVDLPRPQAGRHGRDHHGRGWATTRASPSSSQPAWDGGHGDGASDRRCSSGPRPWCCRCVPTPNRS